MLNMAIFHLTVKTGSRLGGQSARAKADYIEREGKYERQDDELAHRESENMPEWAEDDQRSYWEAADEHERVNGRLFREVEFALPRELNESDQVELAREFAAKLTSAGGERLPYTLAVHRGKGENPHAHLMISERPMTASSVAGSSGSSVTTARSRRKGARARAWQRGRRIG